MISALWTIVVAVVAFLIGFIIHGLLISSAREARYEESVELDPTRGQGSDIRFGGR